MSNDKFKTDNSTEIVTPGTPQELISLGCAILRVVLMWLTSEAAHRIGRRIENLSRASFVPDSGSGNDAAAAFLMDMTDRGFYQLAGRRNLPVAKPGDEFLYRFSDITKTFEAPTDPEQSGEMLRPRCAKKKPSVSTRPKPKKK